MKSFLVLVFLFSSLSFSNINYSKAQCDAATGVCLPGQIEEEDRRVAELADKQAREAAEARANSEKCGGENNFNCYTLLESYGTEEGVKEEVIISETGLGVYLEQMMTYMLMIVTIAAVFFMIYGGILYLTTDIVNKKAEGREVITRVVIGLIFVFSVWTIMNSINEGLLKNSLNFSLKGIGVSIKEALPGGTSTSTAPAGTTPTPGGTTPATPAPSGPSVTLPKGGICEPANVIVVYGIKVCNSVSDNFKKMLDKAKVDGITLTAAGPISGWRSMQDQEFLRKKHCGGEANVYNANARCKPLTALPGQSNHQNGQAVDFAEAGSRAGGKNSLAYKWLDKNAASFGFYNKIASEPWHWSVSGK